MNNKNLKNEQGRSMVEMLGVLAVMGLLTIIGIAGFRYAMNKHYANQTVERLMRRAVVVAAQANFGQNLSLHEFDENDGEYPIRLLDRTDNESFTMQADNVPHEVCQQIVGMDWKLAKIIPENCSDTSMKFKFLNDLGDCSTCVAESVACPPEEELECGKCSVVRGFLDNDDDCEGNENGQYCVKGHCSTCPNDTFKSDNNCLPCDEVNYQCTTADQLSRCPGKGYGRNAACLRMHPCTEDQEWPGSDAESCKACPNRCYSGNTCYRAGPGTNYLRNEVGDCICKENFFYDTGSSSCRSCDEIDYQCTTTDQLSRCPNKGYGRYVACLRMQPCIDEQDFDHADAESCKACTNRCYLNGTCYRAGPGQAHQRVSESDGTCQ